MQANYIHHGGGCLGLGTAGLPPFDAAYYRRRPGSRPVPNGDYTYSFIDDRSRKAGTGTAVHISRFPLRAARYGGQGAGGQRFQSPFSSGVFGPHLVPDHAWRAGGAPHAWGLGLSGGAVGNMGDWVRAAAALLHASPFTISLFCAYNYPRIFF